MVYYIPDDSKVPCDPDQVANQLATQLARNTQVPEKIPDRVRESETPLAVPIGDVISSTGSLRSILRYSVLKGLRESDNIVHISFSKVDEEKWAGITTHPSLLEQSNRLLPQPGLAKAYQYGYWPTSWRIVEEGHVPNSVDSVAGFPHEQRTMELTWKDNYDKTDVETEQHWFTDADAVREFAAYVTDDDISWAQYIPWYRTTAVPTYRLNQVAHTTDWSEFPKHPDARPSIENRFDTSTNPRVGDFIRLAALRKLERHLPLITNLSTGPGAWTTDRVSLVVDPTAAEGRPNTATLCPHVALIKLAEYGYRPIDGWYDAPAVGYESDDPILPRRIEFARGRALQEWCKEIQMDSPLFKDATRVRENTTFTDLDWEAFVPCVQSKIISYKRLHDLAQNPEALF